MPRSEKQPVRSAKSKKQNETVRKGDTSRTSSQGRKQASGGSKSTDNRGHHQEDSIAQNT